MNEKMRKSYEAKLIEELRKSRTALDEKEVAERLGIKTNRAITLLCKINDSGKIEVFTGSTLLEIAKENNLDILKSTKLYCAMKSNKTAARKRVARIVKENIEYENRMIDSDIAQLTGKEHFQYVDPLMDMLGYLSQMPKSSDRDKTYNFILDQIDSRMKSKIKTTGDRIEKVQGIMNNLEKFKMSYKS